MDNRGYASFSPTKKSLNVANKCYGCGMTTDMSSNHEREGESINLSILGCGNSEQLAGYSCLFSFNTYIFYTA